MNITQKDPNENVLEMPPVPQRSPAPVCPHCGVDPCQMGAHVLAVGGGIPVAVFCCAACRKILGMSIIPPAPEPQAQRSESRLVIP